MKATPGRNDPCPCGSGLKYKHCHEGKSQVTSRRVAGVPVWAVALAVVAVIGAGMWFMNRGGSNAGVTPQQPVGPVRAGTPWEYDAATNTHWDPGHGHWHAGPPPTNPDSLPAVGGPAGATPAPYQYDSTTNRHWDPGHGHWHEGPPPAGAQVPGGTTP